VNNKGTSTSGKRLQAQLLGRLRQEDGLSPALRDQPGQHSETQQTMKQ
jgi:hypothetical protein